MSPRLSATFERAEYREQIPDHTGRTRPGDMTGPLTGVHLYDVDFWLGDRLLEGFDPNWAEVVVRPGIEGLLLNLVGDDRIIIDPAGLPLYPRHIGDRRLWLNGRAAFFVDYILPTLTADRQASRPMPYGWFLTQVPREPGSIGHRSSEMLVEIWPDMIGSVVSEYWQNVGFKGYILSANQPLPIVDWITQDPQLPWRVRRGRELERALMYFEGCADACSVRIWTKSLTEDELRSRVQLEALNDMLATVSVEVPEPGPR